VSGEGFDRGGSIAVGDTPLDVEAGHGAQIRVTAVATGEYRVDELREAGADWTVETLKSDSLPF
jgi:phosphoglycolate phosphatase-like HAD superfamily hydrolase